jgi:hypothetical protein
MLDSLQSDLSRCVTEHPPIWFIYNAALRRFSSTILGAEDTKTPAGEEDRRAFLITKPDLGGGGSGPLPCIAREEDERCR